MTDPNLRYKFGYNGRTIEQVLLVKETEKTITYLDQGKFASKHPWRRNKSSLNRDPIFSSLDEIKREKSRRLLESVEDAKEHLRQAEAELESWGMELEGQ